jgi:hypothetical protein
MDLSRGLSPQPLSGTRCRSRLIWPVRATASVRRLYDVALLLILDPRPGLGPVAPGELAGAGIIPDPDRRDDQGSKARPIVAIGTNLRADLASAPPGVIALDHHRLGAPSGGGRRRRPPPGPSHRPDLGPRDPGPPSQRRDRRPPPRRSHESRPGDPRSLQAGAERRRDGSVRPLRRPAPYRPDPRSPDAPTVRQCHDDTPSDGSSCGRRTPSRSNARRESSPLRGRRRQHLGRVLFAGPQDSITPLEPTLIRERLPSRREAGIGGAGTSPGAGFGRGSGQGALAPVTDACKGPAPRHLAASERTCGRSRAAGRGPTQ